MKNRLDLIRNNLSEFKIKKESIVSNIEGLSFRVSNNERDKLLLTKVQLVFDELMSKVQSDYVESISGLVTSGLRSIFGKDYEFVVKEVPYRGYLTYEFKIKEGETERDILDSHGGGVANIVSTLLRVIVILISEENFERVLFLDESLGNISLVYQEATVNFLKDICNKLGFKVLLISHQETFIEGATNRYKLERVENEVRIVKY